jgi:hypothetical protein
MPSVTTITGGTKPTGAMNVAGFSGEVTAFSATTNEIRDEESRDPVTKELTYKKTWVETLGTVSLTVQTNTAPTIGGAPAVGDTDLLAMMPGGGVGYKVVNVSKTGVNGGVPIYQVTLRYYPTT